MKILSFKFLIIIAFFSQSNFAQYPKIDLSTISEEKKTEVNSFVYEYYTSCDELPDLKGKKATSRFRKYFNEAKIKKRCEWFVERFGEIIEIELAGVVIRNDYQVFRYKVVRSKFDFPMELRVFLDKKGKYAGLTSKGFWDEKFYDTGESPKLKKVDSSLINDSTAKKNKELAFKSYNVCTEAELYDVNDINGLYRSIRKGWKTEMLKECDSIKTKNGNFKNLRFEELLTDSIGIKIYRYKVDFDKLSKSSEIRIYSALNEKYSGIFVVDVWYDRYFKLKKVLEKSRNELGN